MHCARIPWAVVLLFSSLLTVAFYSSPAEAGWRDWVPFSSSKPQTSRRSMVDGKPLVGHQDGVSTNGQTFFGRLGDGTRKIGAGAKGLWNSTTRMLSFKKEPESTSRYTPGYSGAQKRKEDNQPGFFQAMFRKPEEKKPRTVTEFMKQEKPGF